MIRWNGRILAASASTLLVLTTSCTPGDDADTAASDGESVESPRAAADAAEPQDADGFLDPNTATLEALAAAGLGEVAAAALVEARPHEGMATLDALLAEHLDGAAREDLYERLWIPIDLNSASRDEILLIPGVGERMANEFDEYRPYRAIEEFRREMGKYVDEEEVARLERYVSLR
ncbi:MAG: hypothetical protein ABFS34_11275 [Gemmatimonadota bacterium]